MHSNSIPKMQVVLSAFDKDASLDVLDHPVLNLIYYMVLCYLLFYFIYAFYLFIYLKMGLCANSWWRSYPLLWSCTFCASCLPRESLPNIIRSGSHAPPCFKCHLLPDLTKLATPRGCSSLRVKRAVGVEIEA